MNIRTALTASACLCAVSLLYAQDYPVKSIRMVVPFPAGGGSDTVARVLAQRLSVSLGQTMVADNRAGASGNIAAEIVAKAPADGYTLLFGNPALSANPALNDKLPYDTLKNLAPVCMVAASFNVLVVHPSLPVKSVRELVTLAKSKPGQLNYASAGEGSAIYLAMAMFQNTTGIDVVHIPYKGAGPALVDVVGGQVPMMFIASPPAVTYVNSGKLRALGVSSSKRLSVLPEVPTIAESGYRGFEVNNWYGVLAPGDTPAALVARLNSELNAVIANPDVKERMVALGAEPAGGSAEQFGRQLRDEIALWRKVFAKSPAGKAK